MGFFFLTRNKRLASNRLSPSHVSSFHRKMPQLESLISSFSLTLGLLGIIQILESHIHAVY